MRWTNWRTGKRRFRREGHYRRVSFVACTANAWLLGAGIGCLSMVQTTSGHDVWDLDGGLVHRGSTVRIRRRRISGGRLRTRWVSVHTEEVYFRDTTQGLVVWGVGAIVTAWLLASGVASVVSGAAHAGGSALEATGTATGTSCASRRPSGFKRGEFGGFTGIGIR
jgi:hypothetical protein